MKAPKNKKIAFLDRDGVINKKADDHCYITSARDFIFNDSIFEVVSKLTDAGFEFIIITNQRGIARALFSELQLAEIHTFMIEGFREKGIKILDIFYCPHEINACECRKPKAGMLISASKRYQIDLDDSILISDSHADITMGEKFGIGKNIFIQSDNLEEAIVLLKKQNVIV